MYVFSCTFVMREQLLPVFLSVHCHLISRFGMLPLEVTAAAAVTVALTNGFVSRRS